MLAAHTHGACRARLHAARWAGRRLSLVAQLGASRLCVLARASGAAGSRVFAHGVWQCMITRIVKDRLQVCLCYFKRLTDAVI